MPNFTMRARLTLKGLGHIEYDAFASPVPMGEDAVPAEMVVTFPGDAASPSLEMTLAVIDGVPSCRDLRIVAKDGHRGVTSGDLRGVRLEDWIEDLFAVATIKSAGGGAYTVRTLEDADLDSAAKAVRTARRGARRKITDQMLAEVADVYRANVKTAPTQAVADRFAVSHRTASLYVRRARDQGLLPATSRGRKDA